jgi:hypothetical protein
MRLVLQACHVRLIQAPTATAGQPDTAEERDFLRFWSAHSSRPMEARNFLVSSVCSQLCSLFDAKLALVLVLLGGVVAEHEPLRLRANSHLLFVGDPGTGKSRLMQDAAALAARCASFPSSSEQAACTLLQRPRKC